MDIDAKLTTLHTIAGIIAGYASFKLTNEALAVVVAIIILIVVGNISERLFGKEEVGGTKGWFWGGIVPFFFVWIMVWIILYNA